MKFVLSLFIFALIYTAHTLPINEPSTGASGSAATVPVESKVEAKSELPSTPSAEEKQPEGAKESSSLAPPASPSSVSANDEHRSTLKDTKLPEAIKPAPSPSSLPVPEVTNPTKQIAEPSTGVSEAAKPAAPVKEITADAPKSETPIAAETKVEQQPQATAASEQPKESNSQINAVSVDEPKPVQNDVGKSEIVAKDEVKSEPVKNEVKTVEKSHESNERSPMVSVPAPVSDVSSESSSDEKSSETHLKKISSSEEKGEDVSKEDKKEVKPSLSPVPAAPVPQPEKKVEPAEVKPAEVKPEKPIAAQPQEVPASAGKSEDGSVKPVVEATEQSKASPTTPTAAVSPQQTADKTENKAEKKESERESVIKREAGKDKYDEKKPVEGYPKKEKVKASPNKESSHDIKRE